MIHPGLTLRRITTTFHSKKWNYSEGDTVVKYKLTESKRPFIKNNLILYPKKENKE